MLNQVHRGSFADFSSPFGVVVPQSQVQFRNPQKTKGLEVHFEFFGDFLMKSRLEKLRELMGEKLEVLLVVARDPSRLELPGVFRPIFEDFVQKDSDRQ